MKTLGQFFFGIVIFIIVIITIYMIINILEDGTIKDVLTNITGKIIENDTPNKKEKEMGNGYFCLTTYNNIPRKVIIINFDNAICYSKPDIKSKNDGISLSFLNFYFLFKEQTSSTGEEFVLVGSDPFSNKTIGWIKKNDTVFYNTRQAFRAIEKFEDRMPIIAWKNIEDIDDKSKIHYMEGNDPNLSIKNKTFLLLSIKDQDKDPKYQFLVHFQSHKSENQNICIGWSRLKNVPFEFVYYITKNELRTKIEQFSNIIRGKQYGENPIIKLFSSHVETVFGKGLNVEGKNIGYWQQFFRDTDNIKVSKWFKKNPDEIQKDIFNMDNQLNKMRKFFDDNNNWNEWGGAWLPESLLFGN